MQRWPAQAGWRALFALLILGVCWLAFDPKPPAAADTGWDKANHAQAFAVLAACALPAFPRLRPWRLALGLLGLGIFIELVQSQIPGRSAEVLDVAGDAVGFALVLIPAALRRRA